MPIPDPRFDRLLQGQSARPQGGNWLQKAGAVVVTLVVFALAMTFSVVLFAVVASIGLLVWGYLWWKTRDLRKQMRDHPPGGLIIEGEVIRESNGREDRPG